MDIDKINYTKVFSDRKQATVKLLINHLNIERLFLFVFMRRNVSATTIEYVYLKNI